MTADGPGLVVHPNPQVERTLAYDDVFPHLLDAAGHRSARAEIASWPGYAATPLVALKRLARDARIGALHVKDESGRFGLGSFKAMGGAYAVYRALAAAVERATGVVPSSRQLAAGEHAAIVRRITVSCASEGNHGQAVAWGAARFGCRASVYLRRGVSRARADAIARHGATIVRVPGTYDDAVHAAQADAGREGRIVISDTAYPGCEDVPLDVMQGYTVIAAEVLEALPGGAPPTHVFVQAGVGGLAAAVAAHLWRACGPARPRLVVVEPAEAACILEGARAGGPRRIDGPLATAMTCLACGEPSTVALRILDRAADAFVAIADYDAHAAVARLADGAPPIASSPSGAAGIGGLLAAVAHADARAALALDDDAQVVCINTEGGAA